MRRSILLLDSHVDTAEMYAVGLRMAGFTPMIAADLPSACEHLRRDRPDALVADVRDAAEDGWRLLRDLKSNDAAREMPVLVLTGRASAALSAATRELGCAALLMKPCLPDALAALLQCVLPSDDAAASGADPHADPTADRDRKADVHA